MQETKTKIGPWWWPKELVDRVDATARDDLRSRPKQLQALILEALEARDERYMDEVTREAAGQ